MSKEQKEFEYTFFGTGWSYCPPYVAKLTYVNGKVNREFYKVYWRKYPNGKVKVYGKFNAKPGDLIEKRFNDIMDDTVRRIYKVKESGELELLMDKDEPEKGKLYKELVKMFKSEQQTKKEEVEVVKERKNSNYTVCISGNDEVIEKMEKICLILKKPKSEFIYECIEEKVREYEQKGFFKENKWLVDVYGIIERELKKQSDESKTEVIRS